VTKVVKRQTVETILGSTYNLQAQNEELGKPLLEEAGRVPKY
jgi:hypothetical protein